jgi:hypothetical protein
VNNAPLWQTYPSAALILGLAAQWNCFIRLGYCLNNKKMFEGRANKEDLLQEYNTTDSA